MSSKTRTIIISLILIAGLAGGFFIIKNKDAKIIDSDNDGLSDQEEKIYRTDPNNPDTDNDGYLDGEEIASGYDPLKPAPNDKLSQKAMEPRPEPGALIIEPGTISETRFRNNLTDNNLTETLAGNLAQTMFTAEILNSDQDILATPEGQAKLEQAISASLADSEDLFTLPEISDEEINISEDNSQEAIELYYQQMISVLEQASLLQELSQSEINRLQQELESGNCPLIDGYIKEYQELISNLKKIPVPSTWKEIHKEYLSIVKMGANGCQTIKNQDPIKLVGLIEQISESLDIWAEKVFSLAQEQKQSFERQNE